MKILLLRLDAPLMSFGAPMVDQYGVVQAFPALSMLTGLVANALGWDRRDFERLTELQDRIRYAARIDRRGEPLRDYQIVDLGQPWMLAERAGWTTEGRIAARKTADAEALHIRFRDYRADSVLTVALAVVGSAPPTLDDIAAALDEPTRPLFIGRKCCVPADRINLGIVEAPSLLSALSTTPRCPRADEGPLPASWWDGDEDTGAVGESHVVTVTDERDWRNQVHVGRRFMREGLVDPPEVEHE